MPLPPPPPAALISTGKPISLDIFIASLISFIPVSEPDTIGSPKLFAIFLASILSPIFLISSELGPMNLILCCSKISANL